MPIPIPPSKLFLLQQDTPLSQDAAYKLNNQDRAYIDSQIQAAELHLLQSLLLGATFTWLPVDSGSAAVTAGTAVCLAGNAIGGTVTLATSGALAASGSVFGVAVTSAVAGQNVRICTRGFLPPVLTGLTGTGGIYCIVSGAGVLAQTGSLTAGQYIVGTVDGAGNLNVFAQIPPSTTVTTNIGFTSVVSKSSSFVGVANTFYQISAGAPVTMTIPTMSQGQVIGYVDLLAEEGTNNITVVPPASVQLMIPADIGGATSSVYGSAGGHFVATSNGASASWMSDGATHYHNF